ncbi:MAG TPA: glycoside hydrolase family 28 protein [Clostridia bacterium]|nr:glycoside hydrolase family 28 protein [Clostridia bacterium]
MSQRRKFIQHLATGLAVAVPAAAFAASPFGGATSAPRTVKGQKSTPNYIFNVVDYGAVPDGKTLSTKAIQNAVDDCGKAGGGKVLVTPGVFLSGPIFLRSNVEFEILAGATILASPNFDDYPTIQGRWEGNDRTIFASLFTGLDLENISITGRGTIDGQGPIWWEANRKTNQLRKQAGITEREPENPPGSPLKWPRPRMINLYRCKNILVSGITVRQSPSWNVHPVLCENINIDGITILNPNRAPNTDGIDPESCKDVRISNCYISTGDDCIILKSGYRYREGGVPTENVTITNCVFKDGWAGVGIGSETAGGIRNVVASNCVCIGTRMGFYLKTARGRGNVIENVSVSNWIMRDLSRTALYISMFYSGERRLMPVNEFTPTIRNIHLSDIVVDGAQRAGLVEGLPERAIEDVSIRNVTVTSAKQGFVCSSANGLRFENVSANAEETPALGATNVRELEISRFTSKKPHPQQPVIQLSGVEDAVLQSCTAAPGTVTFLEITGNNNQGITLFSNRLAKSSKSVAFTNGASEAVLEKLT